MKNKADEPNKAAGMRRRAEELVGDESLAATQTLQELRAHQIELEIQNEELRESGKRSRLIAENTSDGIIIFGADNQVQYVSPAYLKQLGYSEAEELTRTPEIIHSLIHPDERDAVFSKIFEAIRLEKSGLTYSYRVKHTAGHYIWREDNATFQYDGSGNYRGSYVICRDVTSRKLDEYNFRTAIENSMQAGVAAIDLTGKQISANRFFSKMVGWTLEELIGKSAPFVYWPPEEIENINDAFQQTLLGKAPEAGFELKFMRKDGELLDVLVNLSALEDSKNETIGWLAVVVDITERKAAEDQLRQLSRAVEHSPASIIITDAEGKIEYANPKFSAITGYSLEEVRGQTPRILKSGQTPVEAYADLWKAIFAGKEWRGEFLNRKKNGELYWESASISAITDPKGSITHFIGVNEDISERKAAEEKIRLLNIELEQLSLTDYLTNLSNRRYFMRRGAEEFKRAQRNNQLLALLMLDIDEFKKVNDAYGHEAGDQALRQVAAAMKSGLREIDLLGRLGGEEFAALLPDTALEDAVHSAERVRQGIEKLSFEISGQVLNSSITISVGVAVISEEMCDVDDLLRVADMALYNAKNSGRNCVVAYHGSTLVTPSRRGN
jgi:diguanylate cyclase (GGDEF)-like protein/PAS domain S-box-containing protein